MKWVFLLTIFCFVSCAFNGRSPAAKTDELHVVFDIDWTIVSEIKEFKNINKNRTIEVQGKTYFVNNGLESFIEELLSTPHMKISFYSGGKKSRNNELLEQIKLKDGRSLKDIAYKVLSNEDLVHIEGVPETLPFSEKHKKDLSKITKNLDQLIMFDDTYDFVVDSVEQQKQHVFFIGKAFEHFESFADAAGKSGEYVPKNNEAWLLNRNRLKILNVAFREAYADYKAGAMTFSEAMKRQEELLDLKSHVWNEHSTRYYRNYHGQLQPSKGPTSEGCFEVMSLFVGLKT